MCLVVHDALEHGAQLLALHLAQLWAAETNVRLEIVLLAGGPLKSRFAAFGRVHDLTGCDARGGEARALATRLARDGVRIAICNSAATGRFLATLAENGIACTSLVHELPGVIEQFQLREHVDFIRRHATKTIFPSRIVRDAVWPDAEARAIVRPQGLYKRTPALDATAQQEARRALRKRLNLAPDARIVLCVGYGDLRKGVDLFVEIAKQTARDAVFVWVGALEAPLVPELEANIASAGLEQRVIFAGFQSETATFYAGADVFALTSREDPFPTVVLEALDAALPVVAFQGAGGFADIVTNECGALALAFNTAAFAQEITSFLQNEPRRAAAGANGRDRVRREYSFRRYGLDLLAIAGSAWPRVSVVVPNYNYERYLPDRLRTIIEQTRRPYEIILLDDASADASVAELRAFVTRANIDSALLVNTENSGSVSRQWLRGVEQAKGDLVWIAEADDLTEPVFLEALCAAFADPTIVMAYTQSLMIDANRRPGGDYLDYVADIDPQRWRANHTADGLAEIRERLSVRNTIPNVSACLFRRGALLAALRENIGEIASYRVAGDWATYVRVLEHGKIAFDARPLNMHRRHDTGVTISGMNAQQLREIMSMQAAIRARYGVTPEAARLAAEYAQKLYEQFGLASAEAPRVTDHPEFAVLLQREAAQPG